MSTASRKTELPLNTIEALRRNTEGEALPTTEIYMVPFPVLSKQFPINSSRACYIPQFEEYPFGADGI